MANPTTEQQNTYALEQAVSINSYFDVNIEGENVRLQVTTRHGVAVERIVKDVENHIEAYTQLRQAHPRISAAEPATVTESGDKKFKYNQPIPMSELPPELPTNAAEGGESEYYREEFDSFEITPQPDGKATVKFYKDKLEFPIGASINKWKHMDIRAMLQSLGDFDPSVPSKNRKAGVQFWVKGSEYVISQGAHKGEKSHYKNLKLIQAIL